eukprot:SAG25_NODE_9050_length_390_cov_1.243986_1_plen_47_part_10
MRPPDPPHSESFRNCRTERAPVLSSDCCHFGRHAGVGGGGGGSDVSA